MTARRCWNASTSGGCILISTGTEVHICALAADILESEGIATRVVSMPCMEHFAAQDQAYRDEVLPPACRARVACMPAPRETSC